MVVVMHYHSANSAACAANGSAALTKIVTVFSGWLCRWRQEGLDRFELVMGTTKTFRLHGIRRFVTTEALAKVGPFFLLLKLDTIGTS